MGHERVEQAAEFMFETRKAGTGHARIPEDIRPRDLNEAYAGQEAMHRLLTGESDPQLAGYKIAATSKAIQEQCNMTEPFLGGILQGMVHTSPHRMAFTDCQLLAYECEMVFRMSSGLSLNDAPYDRARVSAAIDVAYPAFEILDFRNIDFKAIDGWSSIVDNALMHSIVIGSEVTDWQALDITNLTGTLTVNGVAVASALTGEALGHPLDGLIWIANSLAARGRQIKAGQHIITGSVFASQIPKAGDRIAYEIESMGDVELVLS